MKRNLILSLLVGFMALTASAYTEEEDLLPSDRNHWTASVSYDATIPGKWNDEVSVFKFGGGVSLGLDYTLLLPKEFLFEPGFRLFCADESR